MKRTINKLMRTFFKRGEQGVTLVESLVAIAILGGGVLTMILTMSGGVLAIQENDQQAIAQGLARTQLEYTKSYPFERHATTYPAISTPDGYSSAVSVAEVPGGDSEIQKITANIMRDGAVILIAEDYKVNR